MVLSLLLLLLLFVLTVAAVIDDLVLVVLLFVFGLSNDGNVGDGLLVFEFVLFVFVMISSCELW